MTREMKMVAICQEMGWDYFTYLNQPKWFLELIETKFEIDSRQKNA